jgi:hypothetical protein
MDKEKEEKKKEEEEIEEDIWLDVEILRGAF